MPKKLPMTAARLRWLRNLAGDAQRSGLSGALVDAVVELADEVERLQEALRRGVEARCAGLRSLLQSREEEIERLKRGNPRSPTGLHPHP